MIPVLSATGQRRLLEDLTEITAPISQTVRCSFLSLERASGQSTVAELVLRELTRSRPRRVLGVDTRPAQSMHRVLRDGEPLPDDLTRIPAETRAWMRRRDGLIALAFENADHADWARMIAPIVRHFDVVGTDWGPLPVPQAAIAAHTGQVVCVTATYERSSAEDAIAFARALQEQPSGSRPVVVLSDCTRTRSTWPRLVASRVCVPIIAVPHDSALAAGAEATARTLMRIRAAAAVLIRTATGSESRP